MLCLSSDSAVEGTELENMILAVVALVLCIFLGAFVLIPSGIFLVPFSFSS